MPRTLITSNWEQILCLTRPPNLSQEYWNPETADSHHIFTRQVGILAVFWPVLFSHTVNKAQKQLTRSLITCRYVFIHGKRPSYCFTKPLQEYSNPKTADHSQCLLTDSEETPISCNSAPPYQPQVPLDQDLVEKWVQCNAAFCLVNIDQHSEASN